MTPKSLLRFFSILFLLHPSITAAQITYEPAFTNLRFNRPVEIQNAQDGSNRLFVVEQSGIIRVFENDPSLADTEVDTFLDLTSQVTFSSGQEMGLLGLAFHPNYNQNGWFYVYYTTGAANNLQMTTSRFSVSDSNPNSADPNSEVILLQYTKNQTNSNHNGGKIAFGTDGYLYISIGDGGGGNDPQNNSQNINNAFGSILRIDVDINGDNTLSDNGNYEIPSDNPLVDAQGLDEIFAYGIRNTWKFSVDPITNRIFAGDVGQGAFEEINLIVNNGNYGWKRFEANSVANGGAAIQGPGDLTFPIFEYNRSQGDRSITGGYVYRGSDITSLNPSIQSKYIYGDYISGRVWALDYDPENNSATSTLLFKTNNEFISSFGLDENGAIYFSDYSGQAQIYKLVDGVSDSGGISIQGIGEWSALNTTALNGEVNAIAASTNGGIFLGGSFTDLNNTSIQNLAFWTEAGGIQSIGQVNGIVSALELDTNGNLFVGGVFNDINGQALNNVAKWDGTNWTSLGAGIDGSVSSLLIDDNGNLYAAGIFEEIDGNSARNIAIWNGTNWNPLIDTNNSFAGTNNEIRALAFDDNGMLYVGGNFDEAGGNSANRIATWNGSTWGTLGIGTSGFVEAIVTHDDMVYVGGNFGEAGGETVNRIAAWNQTSNTWSSLENGLSNIVNDLIHDGQNLYAAGNFEFANRTNNERIITNRIARWNDSDGWLPLGNSLEVGVDVKINTIIFAEDEDGTDKIYAGGNFSRAGQINAKELAIWQSDNLLNIPEISLGLTIYPNPTKELIHFGKSYPWKLMNLNGQIIKEGKSKQCSLELLSSGIYFLKIEGAGTYKVVKD